MSSPLRSTAEQASEAPISTSRQCRVCLETEDELTAQLPMLQRLDPALVRAAVMADDDLCMSCCLLLGRQAWASCKQASVERAHELLGIRKTAAAPEVH